MALITNKFYHYDFPEIKPQDAEKFHNVMNRIFNYCKNDSEAILNFLEKSLLEQKTYQIKRVLQETELSDVDKQILSTYEEPE